MRILIKPPAVVTKIIGTGQAIMAPTDDLGWFNVEPGELYYVHDGIEGYRVWTSDGEVITITPQRFGLWLQLLDLGASSADAQRLSRGI